MTANPFAALLDGVRRYSYHDYDEDDGFCLREKDVLAALAAAVPADLAEAMWRPIETAPRGGEWFMARTDHGTTRAVHFADEYDRFPISHDGVVWSTAPVEWMPLSAFPSLLARIAAQEAQIAGMTKERDELATANHRQASCIHVTAANLGPDCSATVDGLPKAARHVAAERDALLGAVKGLVEVLDQHETKGPLPDTALMFCWLAAQNVRAVLRGYMLEKPE